jgi:hypothetical protein
VFLIGLRPHNLQRDILWAAGDITVDEVKEGRKFRKMGWGGMKGRRVKTQGKEECGYD